MPPPQPPKPLGKHCSTIFNNTLYTFSSTAFYSISLDKGAAWLELDGGVPTEGAACVHAHRETPDEALYVIGGHSTDPSKTPENGFQGVQRWKFNEKKWEQIFLPDAIAFNLINHGAVYLEDSGQLLLFSGTRWPDTSTPSSMTFLIDTKPPYTITSQPGDKAFPLLNPNVLNWGTAGALVVGGDPNNKNLYIYTLKDGWSTSEVHLENGLPPRGKAGTALVEGSDGGRLLLTFDMSVSPTRYSQLQVLQPKTTRRAHYIPVLDSPVSNWPKYDDKLAPKEVRDGFSLAQDQKYIVVSGGDETDPLCIFDVQRNKWMNATAIMAASDETLTVDSERSSETPSSTSPGSSDSDAAATASSGPKLGTLQILFIVLGAVIFVAILLFAVLMFLRRRKRGPGPSHKRKQSEAPRHDDRMSFQDRGLSFIKETGLGIAGAKPRGPSRFSRDNDVYTQSSLDKELGGALPAQSEQQQRSSGWSKYFSGNSTNLINLPSRTYSSGTRSSYDRNSGTGTNSTVFPYRSGVSERLSRALTPAPLNIQKSPNPGYGLSAQPNNPRGSDASLGSSLYDASVYSQGSISEKPLWNGGRSDAIVAGSPRGWGVLVNDDRASSIYPESATLEGVDEGYGRGQTESVVRGDVSWLNLKQ